MNTARPLPAPPEDSRVYSLQALRGIAAWTVVFSHIMQIVFGFQHDTLFGLVFARYGHYGVFVFFIISGFVMHQTAIKRCYSASTFFKGRIVRLVPAYWIATLVFLAALTAGLLPQTEFSTVWSFSSLLKSLFFIPHEHLSGLGAVPLLTIGWSLNYEMFFYAVLAICILLSPRHAIQVTAAVVIALPLIGLDLGAWSDIGASKALYYFVFGILLSAAWQRNLFDLGSNLMSGAAAIGLLAIACFYHFSTLPSPRFVFSLLVVCVFLLLEFWFRRTGNPVVRVLQWLGDVSYSTYLYHVIVILFLVQLFGVPDTQVGSVAMVGAVIVLTCLLSEISYRLIEQKLGRRLARRRPARTRLPTAQFR